MLLMSLIATLVVAQPASGPASPPIGSPGAAFAVLAQPRAVDTVLDGRRWVCDETGRCIGGRGGTEQPLGRECRRFVARVGAVSAYGHDARSLSAEEIARCNEAAR